MKKLQTYIPKFVFLAVLLGTLFLNLPLPFASGEKQIENDFDLEFSLPPVFIYSSEGRRDPFIPLIGEKEVKFQPEEVPAEPKILEESGYTLIGLMWEKEEIFALIQGEEGKWMVKKGDMIEEFEVVELKEEKGEVVLMRGKKEIIKLRIRKWED